MVIRTKGRFTRPKFSALPQEPEVATKETVDSLLDLIEFNAEQNPDYVFCIQASVSRQDDAENAGNASFHGRSITFRELGAAVSASAAWLSSLRQLDQHGKPKPLALYLESDVGLFFYLVSLLSLDIPVLLLSARLAPPSVQHLLHKTGCDTVLVSARTKPALAGFLDGHVRLETVEPYATFLDGTSGTNGFVRGGQTEPAQQTRTPTSPLILHSSGTTGFPKPITLSPRYPLLYASCHEFPDDEQVEWTNLSTLPLYHGFGLLAPTLSLSIGMTCCFPPSSIIPAGYSTLALLETFDCRSLMTVPSIVGELLSMPPESSSRMLARLRLLEFLAVGGGALAPDLGSRLRDAGVRLVNHYGVTEIGPIAPIFRPGPDYNWRYLRLRSDTNLQLRPASALGAAAESASSPPKNNNNNINNNRCRLLGWPVVVGRTMGDDDDTQQPFEIQDDLERNPAAPPGRIEVRILGRTDDVIVLKTGEKVQPQQLEAALHAQPFVQTAVCLGRGQFEVVLLVQPREGIAMGEAEFVDAIWAVVVAVNPTLDRHARITSRAAIIVKPPHKAVPRTDKGSVSRKMVHEVFADEMRAAYAAMESEAAAAGAAGLGAVIGGGGDVVAGIRKMVRQVFVPDGGGGGDTADDDEQDLFELGMDSLQALRLARLVNSAVASLQPDRVSGKVAASTEFIYRHPSIARLARAVEELLRHGSSWEAGGGEPGQGRERAHAQMQSLVAQFTAKLSTQTPVVVLLTGATGALGVNLLFQLVKRRDVDKVICVARPSPDAGASADVGGLSENSTVSKLRAALSGASIALKKHHWNKIETVEDAQLQSSPSTLSRLALDVTHIVHLAWPMDFRRKLDSFDPHLRMLARLLELGRRAHAANPANPERRVRFIFASSIAAVEQYAGGRKVPERVMEDPATAAPMGYAEAKWVCEHITAFAATSLRDEVEPVVVRIGQLSGPEHNQGVWKIGEHIPTLVSVSRKIGAFPLLKGYVSWIPVDRAARALVDILFHSGRVSTPVLHLENPVRQPASDVMSLMAHELGLRGPGSFLPYDEWLKRALGTGSIDSLADFFEHHFQRLALGDVILDTTKSRRISATLRTSSGLTKELLAKYVRDWACQGFLKA
ncbi:hypothetical protein C7999DRAFT_35641 [Corynascus novoguineensis]|uniref:Carrier domain-containing protein n=1 Tax=Corynascus novoguineensis TaxID=1126955 RepID=A0AAN7CL16_9PEZI|nr:hypothetical protein C7999DRAFT_35641 [Corynascus novoguineensis]